MCYISNDDHYPPASIEATFYFSYEQRLGDTGFHTNRVFCHVNRLIQYNKNRYNYLIRLPVISLNYADIIHLTEGCIKTKNTIIHAHRKGDLFIEEAKHLFELSFVTYERSYKFMEQHIQTLPADNLWQRYTYKVPSIFL